MVRCVRDRLVMAVVMCLVAAGVAISVGEAPRAEAAVGYRALTPARILDTRATGPVGADSSIDVRVTGVGGVPSSGVAAVVLNVTASQPTTDTWVTVWPTGQSRPEASNLNVRTGEDRPNLVIATVGRAGQVSLYNFAGETHLIADVTGWFPAGSDYAALTPQRILDTRASGAVGADSSIDLQVTGVGGVPSSGVGAVVLNVTASQPTADTWVTVWPTGRSRPEASSLNVRAGEDRPNLVIASVGDDGYVSLYNFAGDAHLIADVTGWFPAGSDYEALSPARIVDTRASGAVGADSSIDVQVTGVGGVPSSGVSAVVLNVTASQPTADTWTTIWPKGQSRPEASNLNVRAGDDVPNAVIATVGDDGMVSLYNFAGDAHYIVDVAGYLPGHATTSTAGNLIWTTRTDTRLADMDALDSYDSQFQMPVLANEDAQSANLVQRELVWSEWPCGLCEHQLVIQDLDTGEAVDTFEWPDRLHEAPHSTSPDGRYVAGWTWINSRTNPSKLTIIDRDSGEIVSELVTPWIGTWAWTPESDLIWVVARGADISDPDRYEIARLANRHLDDPERATVLFEIENSITGEGDPIVTDVSADGSQFIYQRGGHLWVAPTTPGGTPHQLTTGPYNHVGATFSPDASQIAFANINIFTGTINVIPNHRSRPINIPSFGGEHELIIGDGQTINASDVLAWEP